jgi:hypothetical protein
VDFGTKPGEKKHFKQKRFHPEGEATSRPVKTSARPFLSERRLLEFVLCKKNGVGEAVHTYVLLSLPPHKKEEKKRKERRLAPKILIMYANTSSGGVPLCHVRS